MPGYTPPTPLSIIPYIPAGSVAYTITRFLNSTQQEQCYKDATEATIAVCPVYINCILEGLDEFKKAGLSGGTQLLTLIPAALAVMPSSGPNVDAILKRRHASSGLRACALLLGSFSGFFPTGKGLRAVGDVVRGVQRASPSEEPEGVGDGILNAKLGEVRGLRAVLYKWDTLYHDEESRKPAFFPAKRWLLVYFSTLIAFVIIYTVIVIGFLGTVTWACDRNLLALSWVLARMAHGLFEAGILALLRKWLSRRAGRSRQGVTTGDRKIGDARAGEQENALVGHSIIPIPNSLEAMLSILEIALRALHGALGVWGTAVMGSTIMIDGIPGMFFLLLLPFLYGAMELLLLGVV